MPYTNIGDVELFFTDDATGDGLALLFVHGYTADSDDWIWQIPHFIDTHRVICVDLRGHGRSSAPPQGYTTAQLADDLLALLDQLGLDRVVVVGHSMGASVASVLAIEHPERIAGVVAVDPAYLLPDEIAAGIRPLLDSIADIDPTPIVQQLVGALDGPSADPALRAWHVRRVAGVAPHVLRQALEAQALGMALQSVSEPYLRRRACPVLSFYADPARTGAEFRLLTGESSRVISWAGAGHWLHQERPKEFNQLVTDWLAQIG